MPVLIQISTQIIRKNDSIIPRWTIPLVVGQLFSIFAEALLLQLSIYENISAFYIHLRGEFWNGRFVDIRQRCIRFKNSILCSAHPLIVFEKYEHVFYRIA